MSPKRILVIAESINVDDSSGSKANVALIHNLNKAGYDLLVLHYTRKEVKLEGIETRNIKENRTSFNFFLSRFQRKLQHWFKWNLAKYIEPKCGFSFTFFNDISSIKRQLGKLNPKDYHLVLSLSKGASFRPHYALLHTAKFHNKWMAYIHDPYPFHYYPEPYKWDEPGFEKKIEFFDELSENCKWAAFPSKLLQEWMSEKFSGFKDKSVIIPHQLTSEATKSKASNFSLNNKFRLLHAGNLMKQRPPFHLIEAFKLFLEKYPAAKDEAELLLIGNASYHKQEIRKYEKNIPQLIVKDYLKYQKVRGLQEEVSVNIILEAKADLSPFLPGKFPHCIAAEKPVLLLGPAKSESRRLLGKDYAYWAEIDDVHGICKLIGELYQLWLKNDKMKMQWSDLKSYLSTENLKSEVDKILNEE